MFDGTNHTLIYDVDRDRWMFGSHERSLTYRCIISKLIKSRYKLEDLKVLMCSPDLLNNVKIGHDHIQVIMKHILLLRTKRYLVSKT